MSLYQVFALWSSYKKQTSGKRHLSDRNDSISSSNLTMQTGKNVDKKTVFTEIKQITSLYVTPSC